MRKIGVLCLAFFLIGVSVPVVHAADGEELVHRISENISRSPSLNGYKVEFRAHLGEVVASGVVDSEETRNKILHIARNTRGVNNIKNEIVISPQELQTQRASASQNKTIAEIIQQVRRNRDLQRYDVQVAIDGSTAVLTGTVDTETQKREIARIARSQAEIAHVNNYLKVRQPLADSDLEENVRAALRQTEDLQADDITVQARNGTVILEGSLPNFKAIDRALATTLMVSGVQDLRSNLTINGKPYRSAWPKTG